MKKQIVQRGIASGKMRRKKVNCYQCHYYYVTWDKRFPHGCKAFNFKSKEFPSSAVYRSSGKDCLMFQEKQ